MIKLFNKEFNISTIISIIILVMGILTVGLQGYFYFKHGSQFLSGVTLVGMFNICLGFYNLYVK